MEFLRVADIASRRGGQSRNTVYLEIGDGLLPKPVKLGARAVGFPSDEIDQVFEARACGANDEQIKSLVARLHGQRAKRLTELLAA